LAAGAKCHRRSRVICDHASLAYPAISAKRKKQDGKPDPAVLATIIREVVEAAGPEKIVLFGSAARGTMGPNSDYDILVIKKGKFSHDRVNKGDIHQL
jgi:predicted nucleotidyltransferase